jgi:hypothetical protein
MPTTNDKPNKKEWKNLSNAEKIIALIFIAVIVIGAFLIIRAIASVNIFDQPANDQPRATSQQEATEAKPEVNLAELTEQELKTQLGVNSFAEGLSDPKRDQTSALWHISDLENVNSSTVRINIQTRLDKDEAKRAGTVAFGLVGGQLEQVKTIVIRDASGVDKANVYRNDVPVLNVGN